MMIMKMIKTLIYSNRVTLNLLVGLTSYLTSISSLISFWGFFNNLMGFDLSYWHFLFTRKVFYEPC
jgi:hypothetical protein